MENGLQICRICLNASKDCIEFQSRFKCDDYDTKNKMNYLECIRLCTNLPLEETDGGPQCLCRGCETELQIVFKFLQKVKCSQDILGEDFWKNKNGDERIEHTEICIESYVSDEIEEFSNGYENELVTQESEYLSELSSDELANVLCDKGETSENNCNASIKGASKNEYAAVESLQEAEFLVDDNNSLEKDTRVFIPKKYKCYICNRSYTTEQHLKVHLYYHKRRSSKSPPYTCKICGESFCLQRFLTQHMIEHQDCRETYKCQFCDKEYVSKTALISHKRIHQAETLNCNECGKQFMGNYEFSVHQRFHKREKEKNGIKCNICYKEFSSSRYLPQHMTVHLGNKVEYSCDYCNKKYSSKTALKNHKRLHEGQTLKCNVCEKRFTRNSELNIHMRFHKREHPFKCTLCEKDFAIKGHLKTHMWQHQNIKVECDACGKLFGSTKALNEHSYTHSQMPYPCELCDKAYPSKQKYKIHLDKVHSTEKNKIDLSQINSISNEKNTKMRKKFSYVQIMSDEDMIN